MILHCKNAEMTMSFLHFYSVKSYNFCYDSVISAFLQCKIIQFLLFFFENIFFLNLAVFYIRENKKGQK